MFPDVSGKCPSKCSLALRDSEWKAVHLNYHCTYCDGVKVRRTAQISVTKKTLKLVGIGDACYGDLN